MTILKIRVEVATDDEIMPILCECEINYTGLDAAFPTQHSLETAFYEQHPDLASKIPMHDPRHHYGIFCEVIT